MLFIRREGASSQQRKWYLDFKEKITKTCKEAILKVKNSIERSTLTGNEELFMNGYFDYVRPPSGDEKVGPTLSVKLAESYDRIYSKFFKWDERVPTNGGRIQFVNIDPFDLIRHYCKAKFVIQIGAIFIREGYINLQIRLDKALISPLQSKISSEQQRQRYAFTVGKRGSDVTHSAGVLPSATGVHAPRSGIMGTLARASPASGGSIPDHMIPPAGGVLPPKALAPMVHAEERNWNEGCKGNRNERNQM